MTNIIRKVLGFGPQRVQLTMGKKCERTKLLIDNLHRIGRKNVRKNKFEAHFLWEPEKKCVCAPSMREVPTQRLPLKHRFEFVNSGCRFSYKSFFLRMGTQILLVIDLSSKTTIWTEIIAPEQHQDWATGRQRTLVNQMLEGTTDQGIASTCFWDLLSMNTVSRSFGSKSFGRVLCI